MAVWLWQAIDKVKDNAMLYTNRAQTLIKLGKYEEALKDCDWALRVSVLSWQACCLTVCPLGARGWPGSGFCGKLMAFWMQNLEDKILAHLTVA